MTTVASRLQALTGLVGATLAKHLQALAPGSTVAAVLRAYSGLTGATMAQHLLTDRTAAPTPVYSGSGVGGGSTGHVERRRKEWLQLTTERARRYDELFRQLLAKELELEAAKKAEQLKLKKRRIRRLQRLIEKILTEIDRIETTAREEEDQLILAFILS